MKWLINYLRQCFCKHEWELLYSADVYSPYRIENKPYKREYHYVCKKCMYHKKIEC